MADQTYEMASYQLADVGARLAAWFIDGGVLFLIEGAGFYTMREPGLSAGIIVGLIYTWFFLTRNNGQTVGKMLMKIRVVKTDGTPISDADAVLRYVGYLLDGIFLLGWLSALFDENRQCWHDKLAKHLRRQNGVSPAQTGEEKSHAQNLCSTRRHRRVRPAGDRGYDPDLDPSVGAGSQLLRKPARRRSALRSSLDRQYSRWIQERDARCLHQRPVRGRGASTQRR